MFQQPANVMGIPGFAGSGSQDPFKQALLSMFAANNPDLVAKIAAAHGIAPPNPTAPSTVNPAVGAFMQPQAAPADVGNPAAATPAASGAANPWSMLQGFKGPQTPAPIFSGGVSGAQKAPDVNVAGQNASSQALMQLVQSLLGTGQPPPVGVRPVGGLGSYIGGR